MFTEMGFDLEKTSSRGYSGKRGSWSISVFQYTDLLDETSDLWSLEIKLGDIIVLTRMDCFETIDDAQIKAFHFIDGVHCR